MTAPIRERLQADLMPARRAQDQRRVEVLGATLAAIANAEAVDLDTAGSAGLTEVERRLLSESDVVAIVTAERDELDEVAEELESFGEISRADELRQQAAILSTYLDAGAG